MVRTRLFVRAFIAVLFCLLLPVLMFGQYVQQGGALVGTGALGSANQGASVAISSDGNTAAVGGFADSNSGGSGRGATWMFARTGNTWNQEGAKLVGAGTVGAVAQGSSVAVSADGNTMIAGGPGYNSNVGGGWIYVRSLGVWSQQGGSLTGSGSVGQSRQGYAVSISADGNTAILGGQGDSSNAGAAWVFTRSGTVWNQQGSKLVGVGASGSTNLGSSVSLSADGNTAIIGAPGDSGGVGAARVFTRSGSVWSQQGNKLAGTGYSGTAHQGGSVALSSDGNTALVGGGSDSSGTGAAWVFIRSGGVWSQQGNKLVGSAAVGSAFGSSVTLSGDGNTAAIGGYLDNGFHGAVWVFKRSGGVWSQQGGKIVSSGTTFGSSVSMSGDANTLLVGSIYDSAGAGAARVFERPTTVEITASAGPHGSISPSGSVIVPVDTTITFDITPAPLYTIQDVHVDTISVGPVAHYTFNSINANHTIEASFTIQPAETLSYRSIHPDSLAKDKDQKGRAGKLMTRKADKDEFEIVFVNDTSAVNGLHAEFSSGILLFYPFSSIPPFTHVSFDQKVKKWDFTFDSTIHHGDTVLMHGFANKGKPVTVGKYYWENGATIVGKKEKNPVFTLNQPKRPMPNRLNVLFETFVQGGFGGTFLLIGVDRSVDSAKQYGWINTNKYSDALKSLRDKTGLQTGFARGFDTYTTNKKPIVKRQKSIPPGKQNNKLIAEMIALSLNIGASRVLKTTLGFGELIYDDGAGNPYNGLMVKEIAAKADTLMMGRYVAGIHKFADTSVFRVLNQTIEAINNAFEGPIDTVDWTVNVTLKGARKLLDVPFLHANPGVVPAKLVPLDRPIVETPQAYRLYQNYPNPFNPTTTIQFDLTDQSIVTLKVFNVLGQEVATLLDRVLMEDGSQEVDFNAGGLASGVYFYRLITEPAASQEDGTLGEKFSSVRKMLLIK